MSRMGGGNEQLGVVAPAHVGGVQARCQLNARRSPQAALGSCDIAQDGGGTAVLKRRARGHVPLQQRVGVDARASTGVGCAQAMVGRRNQPHGVGDINWRWQNGIEHGHKLAQARCGPVVLWRLPVTGVAGEVMVNALHASGRLAHAFDEPDPTALRQGLRSRRWQRRSIGVGAIDALAFELSVTKRDAMLRQQLLHGDHFRVGSAEHKHQILHEVFILILAHAGAALRALSWPRCADKKDIDMKIIVMGAGGVGGVFGARLLQGGCDVAFLARGAHLAALQRDGLRIDSEAHGALHLPDIVASDSAQSLGVADYVLIAVKLADSQAAAQQVRPAVGPHTTVMSLQNGIDKDRLLQQEFGAAAVLGGVAYVGAYIAQPGVVHQIGSMQGVSLGEYDGQRSARVTMLAEAFKRGGIKAHVSEDIRRTLWEKLVLLVGLSAVTTAMRSALGPIRNHSRSRQFLLQLMRETVQVGRAEGVDLPADMAEQRLAFIDTMPDNMDSSMHHDLRVGRPLEVNWLSGAVVRLGARHGVPTPANDAVCALLALHAS